MSSFKCEIQKSQLPEPDSKTVVPKGWRTEREIAKGYDLSVVTSRSSGELMSSMVILSIIIITFCVLELV